MNNLLTYYSTNNLHPFATPSNNAASYDDNHNYGDHNNHDNNGTVNNIYEE